MASSFHPIWKQFAFRYFSAGDSAKHLFQRFSPNRKEEFGRYGVYDFYPGDPNEIVLSFVGLTVTTKDGTLSSAKAWSCTWQFTFFETSDPEFDKEYAAFAKQRLE